MAQQRFIKTVDNDTFTFVDNDGNGNDFFVGEGIQGRVYRGSDGFADLAMKFLDLEDGTQIFKKGDAIFLTGEGVQGRQNVTDLVKALEGDVADAASDDLTVARQSAMDFFDGLLG